MRSQTCTRAPISVGKVHAQPILGVDACIADVAILAAWHLAPRPSWSRHGKLARLSTTGTSRRNEKLAKACAKYHRSLHRPSSHLWVCASVAGRPDRRDDHSRVLTLVSHDYVQHPDRFAVKILKFLLAFSSAALDAQVAQQHPMNGGSLAAACRGLEMDRRAPNTPTRRPQTWCKANG